MKTFLKWQTPSWSGSIKHCFSISFDFDNDLDILMYNMTLDFNAETIDRFNIATADDCFIVFVGGKYVDMIDQVASKVEIIGKKILSKAKVFFLDTNDKKMRSMKETYPPLVKIFFQSRYNKLYHLRCTILSIKMVSDTLSPSSVPTWTTN